MAYVEGNPKSKMEIKKGLASGAEFYVFQPGLGTVPRDGIIDLCGPHYPSAHKFYCTGIMKNGVLVAIK